MATEEIEPLSKEELKEIIDSTISKNLQTLKQKEEENTEPKFSIGEIISHQERCKDANCPACSVLTKQRIANKFDKVLDLAKKKMETKYEQKRS